MPNRTIYINKELDEIIKILSDKENRSYSSLIKHCIKLYVNDKLEKIDKTA